MIVQPQYFWQAIKLTSIAKSSLRQAKGKQLYWGFGSGLFRQPIPCAQNALPGATRLGEVTSYLGWTICAGLFAIDFSLLFKNLLKGSWVNRKDESYSSLKQLKMQWQERKFDLINNLYLGLGNAVHFFLLAGEAGNIFSLDMLLVYVCLILWQISEEEKKHARYLAKLNNQINELKCALNNEGQEKKDKINKLNLAIKELEMRKAQAELDWKQKKKELQFKAVFISGLFVSVSLIFTLCLPHFITVAQSTVFILSCTGLSLALFLTIAHGIIGSQI